MNELKSALRHRLARTTISILAVTLAVVPLVGCDTNRDPRQTTGQDTRLRSDFAALRSIHGDPDSIGSLDSDAAPVDLNNYRHAAAFRTISAARHPIR
jgi:hypothetical protein